MRQERKWEAPVSAPPSGLLRRPLSKPKTGARVRFWQRKIQGVETKWGPLQAPRWASPTRNLLFSGTDVSRTARAARMGETRRTMLEKGNGGPESRPATRSGGAPADFLSSCIFPSFLSFFFFFFAVLASFGGGAAARAAATWVASGVTATKDPRRTCAAGAANTGPDTSRG